MRRELHTAARCNLDAVRRQRGIITDGDRHGTTSALLNGPDGVAVDATGSLYIADTGNPRIRKVSHTGSRLLIPAAKSQGAPRLPFQPRIPLLARRFFHLRANLIYRMIKDTLVTLPWFEP